MNNFTKRIIFGLIYVALVISSSLLGALFFYSLFLVFMLICIYEFIKILELKSIYPYLLGITSFFTAVISNNNLIVFEDDLSKKITLSIFLTAVYFSFILALASSRKIAKQYLAVNFLTLIYVALPFSLLIKIPYLNFDGTFDTSIIIGIFILSLGRCQMVASSAIFKICFPVTFLSRKSL